MVTGDTGMVKNIYLEMSEATICTGSAVPAKLPPFVNSDAASCRSEELKSTMRLQMSHSQECQNDDKEFGSFHDGINSISPSVIGRHIASSELSSSLPNLNAGVETNILNGINDKVTRNSLTNILSNGAHDLDFARWGVERGQPDGSSQSDSPHLVRPRTQIDLPIKVDGKNSRLSAVLENIPLYYIPHTKQLVSMSAKQEQSQHSGSSKSPSHDNHNPPVPDAVCKNGHSIPNSPDKDSCIQSNNGHVCIGAELAGDMLNQDSDPTSECTLHNTSAEFDDVSLNTLEADAISKLSLDQTPDTQKSNTGLLTLADAASFSSVSSLSTATDFSLSTCNDDYTELSAIGDDDTNFMEVNLHSRNSYEKSRSDSQDSGPCSVDNTRLTGAKPKRKGFTGFLARGLFSRKSKEQIDTSDSAPGWKLFGRVPLKQTPAKDPDEIKKEYEEKCRGQQVSPLSVGGTGTTGLARHKKSDIMVASTTALILENRPEGLPSKDPEEELKHRQEYEAMVEAAKKREQKEAKLRKKQLQRQLQQEEAMAAAVKIWNQEILPSWESVHSTKRVRDIWWSGIPPSVRGRVWQLAIANELNITAELYEICLKRAKDRLKLISEAGDSQEPPSANKESSVELIKLDVSRTFPQLCIFQKGGPYHELLQGLLGAYVCYRPDVGYVQGMSFIAAVLLLNMDVAEAFITFTNLLNRPCQIAFFRLDKNLMQSYFSTYEEFFCENLPKLASHFEKQGVTPDLYIIDWMFTMYSRSLPLDVASRVWDVFCRDGEEFLFRTALGILKLYEDILLNMDFIHLAQFLTKLPDNIQAEALFRYIDNIHMTIDKKKFNQVLNSHRDSVKEQQQSS